MAKDKTIHLLIVHKQEEEAERILSILRNAQIQVRPSRCIDEDSLAQCLTDKRIDLILVQQLQNDLSINAVNQQIKHIGKDIPIIALIDNLDGDSISEVYDAGVNHFCIDKINNQLCTEITNVHQNLLTRRELRSNQAELNDAEKRCASLLDSSKDAIAYIHEGMHVYTNNAYLDFFKYNDPEEMEVTPFLNLVAKDQVQYAKKLLKDISAQIIPDEDIDMVLKAEDGEEIKAVVSFNVATVDGERCVQFLVRPPKINKEAEKELHNIKNKDMLTGFYNRNYFSKTLSDKVNAVKSGQSKGCSILFLQIDDDKKLEKELGKGNLDLLTADIAPYIQETIGKNNIFARYDNTIFAIAMEGQIEKANQVAEHIVKKFTDHLFNAGEKTLSCTLSVGITQIIEKTESGNEVIKILGKELLKARENGGNQTSTFDPAEEEKLSPSTNLTKVS